MKLRVRSLSTNATVLVTAPDSSTLADLKSLIAAQLSPTITDPSSLLLSLNRRSPLLSSDPAAPLASLGLTSDDLIFLLHPDPLQLAEGSGLQHQDSLTLGGGSVSDSAMQESSDPEAEPEKKPPLFASFLKDVMEAEQYHDDIGRLAIAIHAVFLQSGFVISSDCFLPRVPRDSPVRYTIPEFADCDGVEVVTLRFSATRRHVSIHGFVSGSDGHRVCLNVLKMAPTLDLEGTDEGLFYLWKVVREGLALPLLIDLRETNGLALLSCFARLPTELKTKIIELLPGEDLARVSCVGKELRSIASDDELWRMRFGVAFWTKESTVEGMTWKDMFGMMWLMTKEHGFQEEEEEDDDIYDMFLDGIVPQSFKLSRSGFVSLPSSGIGSCNLGFECCLFCP